MNTGTNPSCEMWFSFSCSTTHLNFIKSCLAQMYMIIGRAISNNLVLNMFIVLVIFFAVCACVCKFSLVGDRKGSRVLYSIYFLLCPIVLTYRLLHKTVKG